MDPTAAVIISIVRILRIYEYVLIARILLSWFPVNWHNQPFKFLRDITDPIMEPFRRLVPPLGMIDISPMLLFLVIIVLQRILLGVCGAACRVGF